MKLTIEATATTAALVLELNGDTFRQSWSRRPGYAEGLGKDFWAQAKETGKYDESQIQLIFATLDGGQYPFNWMDLARECEKEV